MANEQTLPLEVTFKAQDGSIQVRKFILSLSIDPALVEGEENPGDTTINVVMPVGSTDPGTTSVETEPSTQVDSDEAIAA